MSRTLVYMLAALFLFEATVFAAGFIVGRLS